MPSLSLIALFLFVSWGVLVVIPIKEDKEKGWIAYLASMVITGSFLGLVYLVKLIIVA